MSNYTGAVPDTVAHRRDWMERMACRDEDTNLFFEQKFEHLARVVCVVRCPVRAECLAHILEAERGKGRDYRHGIVAGLDGKQRWRLDASAPGHSEDGTSLLKADDPAPQCGTEGALMRHLSLGERVDSVCWSAEVQRDHENRAWRRRHGHGPGPEALPEAS
ncbi:WhiB family transcriptional regulator [Streptomyces brasiliscabiei]|uniref:WhiB family transcriptional regulator n=1 Tax=Streptomyces brasiliscabiei TaxID=2736302 RepID=A0ABU8G9X9_9ACTN